MTSIIGERVPTTSLASPAATFPGLELLIEEARRRQRRRRRAVALSAVGLAAAAAVAYVGVSTSASGPSIGSVAARAAAALSGSGGEVLFTHTVSRDASWRSSWVPYAYPEAHDTPPTISTSWTNLRSGSSRTIESFGGQLQGSRLIYFTRTAHALTIHQTGVSYNSNSWSSMTGRFALSRITPGVACGCDPLRSLNGDYRSVVLLPNDSVDGQPAFHIRIRLSSLTPGPTGLPTSRIDLWVNRATGLPVRQTQTGPSGSSSVTDYRWFPATPANLARVNAPLRIPASFNRVTTP